MAKRMEHIGKIAGRAELATNCEKSTKEAMPSKWVAALFAKLQAIYLQKWTSAIEGIEELAVKEWGEVLAGMTGEQIRQGLYNLDSEWPPTALEFKKLCKATKGHPSFKEFAPALPRPEVEPEYVENQLEEMRRTLKGE